MEEERYGKNLFQGGWGNAVFRFSLFPFFEGENTDFHPHRAPHRHSNHRHSRGNAAAVFAEGAADGAGDSMRQQSEADRSLFGQLSG